MERQRVRVDFDKCTGEAICTGLAPELFELITVDGEHKAVLSLAGQPKDDILTLNDEAYDALWEATERCPPDAIFIYDVDSGEQLYP